MSENKNENESIFSWSNETKAAKDSMNIKSEKTQKYNPTENYANSIFTPMSGDSYKYDFPEDNDYVYSPTGAYNFGESAKEDFQKEGNDARRLDDYNQSRQNRNGANFSSAQPGEKRFEKPPQRSRNEDSVQTKRESASRPRAKAPSKASQTRRSSQNARPQNEKQKEALQKNKKNPQRKRKPSDAALFFEAAKQVIGEKRQKKHQQKLKTASEEFEKGKTKGKSEAELITEKTKKKKRRQRLLAALTVSGVLCVILIGFLIFCSVQGFPIENIVINGSSIYSNEEILAAGAITKGENMLKIKGKTANETITTLLPYISSVKIKRKLPDTIELTVSETSDRLLIVSGKKYICVDENGKVVSDLKKKAKSGQYKIDGFAEQEYEVGKSFNPDFDSGNKKRYDLAKTIIAALENNGFSKCREIDVSDLECIGVKCTSKLTLYVNDKTDFDYKFAHVADSLKDSQIIGSGTYYIDLRFDNQLVVRDGQIKQ